MIQFVNLGYCFQGHIRPAKMTQNGTFYCIYICLYKTVRPYISFIIGCITTPPPCVERFSALTLSEENYTS